MSQKRDTNIRPVRTQQQTTTAGTATSKLTPNTTTTQQANVRRAVDNIGPRQPAPASATKGSAQ